MQPHSNLPELDVSTLEPIARRALGDERAVIGTWRVEPIEYPLINPIAGGIFRIVGTATVGPDIRTWSAILKVTRPPVGQMTPRGLAPTGWAESPGHWNYWRREALLYRDGPLDDLSGPLVAPICYSVEERPEPSVWLWLEEIDDRAAGEWDAARYGLAARHLGALAGQFLPDRRLPEVPWLARGWLRSWVDDVWGSLQPLIATPERWNHPLIVPAFPEPVADRIERLWHARDRLLAIVERLPHTFVHRDAHPRNLFTRFSADGTPRTVAIDWTQAGPGPVGEDVGQILIPSLLFSLIDPAEGPDLARTLLDQHLAGLADVGWRGDERLVRLGYSLTAALHWCFAGAFALRWIGDERLLATMERQFGRPIDQIIAQRAAVTYFLLDLAEDADRLIDELGL